MKARAGVLARKLSEMRAQELAQVRHPRAAPGDRVDGPSGREVFVHDDARRQHDLVTLADADLLDLPRAAEPLRVRHDRRDVATERRMRVPRRAEPAGDEQGRRDEGPAEVSLFDV